MLFIYAALAKVTALATAGFLFDDKLAASGSEGGVVCFSLQLVKSLGAAYFVVNVCEPRRRLATRSRGCSAQMVPHTYKPMAAPPSAIALTRSTGILLPRVAPASSRQWKVPPRWQRYALPKSRYAAGVPPAPEPPRWRRYAPRPAMSGHMMMRHPNVPGHPNVVRAVREPPLHWAIRHPLLAKSCGRAQMTSSVRTSGTFSFNPQPDVGSCRCAGHCRR